VTTYTSLGASARCNASAGLLSVRLRGVVCLGAMRSLAEQMAMDPLHGLAKLAYYDRALVVFDWGRVCDSMAFRPHPGVASAMIVRGSELDAATGYCAQMAQRGILRMAFTAGEEAYARQWALAAAGLASARPYTRESIRA